jgi:uncharacterized phage protein gp47/JayE
VKTVDEIFEEMLGVFTKETGMSLHKGSEMAVRLYAFAAQIYGLYLQNEWTLRQCFPQTAQNEYLDHHAALRGLSRNGAVHARGSLRFSVAEAQGETLTIPAGTVSMTAGLVRFETTKEGTLPAGSLFVDVPAQAVEPGAGGNVPEGLVRVMAVAPVGIGGCTNPLPFVGGMEAEGDEALRARILETYERMPNGANAAYYEREALSFEPVVAVNVLGRSRGLGTVDVVIAGAAGHPGTEVLTQVKEHLDRQREIAVDLMVLPPKVRALSLSIKLAVEAGEAFLLVKEAVRARLLSYFDGRLLGKDILRAALGQIIFGVPGVRNYEIISPSSDLAIAPGELAVLTGITVEVLP